MCGLILTTHRVPTGGQRCRIRKVTVTGVPSLAMMGAAAVPAYAEAVQDGLVNVTVGDVSD